MGSIKIPIETSARHIHISREDFEKLFGEGKELTFVKELMLIDPKVADFATKEVCQALKKEAQTLL